MLLSVLARRGVRGLIPKSVYVVGRECSRRKVITSPLFLELRSGIEEEVPEITFMTECP